MPVLIAFKGNLNKIAGLLIACTLALNAIGQHGLIIQQGTTVKLSAGVVVTVRDMDLVNNGNLNASVGDGTVTFSGSTANAFRGTSITTLDQLGIAKAGNVSLTLEQDVQVRSNISFAGGLINLNNRKITLLGNAFLNNESETSRIVGLNGGYVEIIMSLNAPQNVNPGNLGAGITSNQNLGIVTIRRGHQSQTNGSGAGNSVLRYYDISPANNSALNATLRFSYFDAELNGLSEPSLVLWKSTNNTQWTNEGFNTRDVTTNFVTKSAIPSFSRWTLSTVGNALPVTGLKLSGRWLNNASHLDWITLVEYNNQHFIIERRYDNQNSFSSVGVRKSKHPDGNSQMPTSYEWTDPAEHNRGTIYYRLQQVDLDGKFSYSNTIALKPGPMQTFIEKLYPTVAVKGSIYMQTGNLDLKQVDVSLYDISGRIFMSKRVNYEPQWLHLPALSAGIYQLRIRGGEWEYRMSFVK